jgi:hypothetical protein
MRYQTMLDFITAYNMPASETEPFSTVYMYYDVRKDGRLKIADHAEYDRGMKELITNVIVDVQF